MTGQDGVAIEFPKMLRYARAQEAWGPLLVAAIEEIRRGPLSEGLRPHLAYQTWENHQPSFMILPFMFLGSADAAGGIGPQHREYLPIIMLTAEMLAASDDAVDRTPYRSDRPSFPMRFGDASAVPFVANLVTWTLAGSRRHPAVFAAMQRCYTEFFGLELWERRNTYPSRASLEAWLANRYMQTILVTEFVMNSALLLSGRSPWPDPVIAAFARIQQNVDDIVNIVELRDSDGENDDLQAGVVTRPLILALAARPELADEVEALWEHHRPLARAELSVAELHAQRGRLGRETLPLYRRIREVIVEHGVAGTVREVLQDFHAAVQGSPPELRPFLQEVAGTFVRRLRSCRHVDLADLPEVT